MSKGNKKQYKQFAINSLEDGCLVLKSLIVPVIIDLEKFRNYSDEAEVLLEKYKLDDFIPANIYDSIHDKILYQQRELLRFMADHQSSSFSYISVRELLEKKGFLKSSLTENSNKTLKELLDIRNWSFHNAQSMLVADLEMAKKSIPSEMVGSVEIKPMLNPVVIRKVKTYTWKMFADFVFHNKVRLAQFELILSEMKKDYQEMYGFLSDTAFIQTSSGLSREVQYIEQEIENQNPKKAGSSIASLSMKIQKGKYDGSNERY
ncbi:hypothetical protein DWW13_02015 [Blautia sp. AF14-40]|uniref:hypothetical protein n=1 Tax=Blautia sp. AF14-40 TaxID=2292958 RepID=UPI000E51009A|nr:hypothetical protein [Blautia sp. AF14-40]RHS07348.1 hypothetical protein DWW13_02015 [Blautia sp. AF14-40]